MLLHYGTSFHNFKDGVGQSVTDIILSELGNTTSMAVAYSWTQKLPSVDTEYKLSIAERTPLLMFDPCCSYRFFVTAITKEDFSYSWRRPKRVLLAVQNLAEENITTKFGQMAYEGSIYTQYNKRICF